MTNNCLDDGHAHHTHKLAQPCKICRCTSLMVFLPMQSKYVAVPRADQYVGLDGWWGGATAAAATHELGGCSLHNIDAMRNICPGDVGACMKSY